ncbi:MAG: Cof-type HAD-IIB family hydrolase [Lachnospiraceae bacterium]|nr:Cof-type HAD-IIB family hydrolase [Lachnospiraceae bacterium]
MKISCIALDLDRTTLNSQGRLSEANKKAIELAVKNGIHVVIASGRALNSLPREVCGIGGVQYAVTSNGAAIYDLHTRKCLKQYKLTADSVRRIVELTKEKGVAFEAFINGKPYAWKPYVEDPVRFGATVSAVPYVQTTRQPVENMLEFLEEHIGELDCLDIVVKGEEKKQEIWAELRREIEDIYITSSIRQLLEISYKDCGKHSGVKFLLEYLGLDARELAAFGDGDNDADMLRFAGVGIAMGNASPECKRAADLVTLSNDEDGVAHEICRLLYAADHHENV